MPRANARPVLHDGKLRMRTAVACHGNVADYNAGDALREPKLMLSVYVLTYRSIRPSKNEEQEWELYERKHVSRNTPEHDQMALLDAMSYKVALQLHHDYEVYLPASPVKPKELRKWHSKT